MVRDGTDAGAGRLNKRVLGVIKPRGRSKRRGLPKVSEGLGGRAAPRFPRRDLGAHVWRSDCEPRRYCVTRRCQHRCKGWDMTPTGLLRCSSMAGRKRPKSKLVLDAPEGDRWIKSRPEPGISLRVSVLPYKARYVGNGLPMVRCRACVQHRARAWDENPHAIVIALIF